jgi:hypothetical protein
MIEHKGHTGVFEFDPELRPLEASMTRAADHCLDICEARGEEPARLV